MAKYQIKISYQTGDSFHTRDAEATLEMVWENIDNAKAALKRIKEHYEWYKTKDSWYYEDEKKPEPEWHKGMEYEFQIKLALDNGNEVTFGAFWCGYFERLYGAEIIIEEHDMKFII